MEQINNKTTNLLRLFVGIYIIFLLKLTGVASAQDNPSKQKWLSILKDYESGKITITEIENRLGQNLEGRDIESLFHHQSPINGLTLEEYFVYYLNAVERCAQSGYEAGFSGIRIRTPQGDFQLVPYSVACTALGGVYETLYIGEPSIDFDFDSIVQQILNVLAQKGSPETGAIYSKLLAQMMNNTWEQARIPFISRDGDPVKRAPGGPGMEEMRSKEEFLEILEKYINQYGVCETLEPFNRNLKKTPFGWQADLPDGRTIYGCYAEGYGTWPYSSVYYSLISNLAAQDSSNVLNIREDNGVLILTIPNSGVYPLLDPNNNLFTIVIVGERSSGNSPAILLIPVGVVAAFVLALFARARFRKNTQEILTTKPTQPKESVKSMHEGVFSQRGREPETPVKQPNLQNAQIESAHIFINISLDYSTANYEVPMQLDLNNSESLEAITTKVTALLLQSVGAAKKTLNRLIRSELKLIIIEVLKAGNNSEAIQNLGRNNRTKVLVNRPNQLIIMLYNLTFSGNQGSNRVVRLMLDFDLTQDPVQITIKILPEQQENNQYINNTTQRRVELVDRRTLEFLGEDLYNKLFNTSEIVPPTIEETANFIISFINRGFTKEDRQKLGEFLSRLSNLKSGIWRKIIVSLSTKLNFTDITAGNSISIELTRGINPVQLKVDFINCEQIIAEKILMYLAFARGGDFEAFTGDAIKILGDRTAASKSGRKIWVGRTGYRLHMVITESSEETQPLKFVFILTKHSHSGMEG